MSHHLRIVVLSAVALAFGSPLPAADQSGPQSLLAPLFDLPAHCQLGETCWIVNYVDVDPGPEAKDFQCGVRTYDGHDGIDLAIRDLRKMEEGVPVLAVAAGTVRRVRDGMPDLGLSSAGSHDTIVGRECGNGLVIDHGGGWETQYCHLKKGSLRVGMGQEVARGSHLGLIGLSGKTEFPHVHLTVRHDGRVIDPFTGRSDKAGCGEDGRALWRDPAVRYEEVALYHAGFSGTTPRPDAIRRGESGSGMLSADAPTLVLWVDIFGVRADDLLRFRIVGPDGRAILDNEQRIDRVQARRFAFAGLHRRGPMWPSGLYHGELTLQRGQGAGRVHRTRHVTVQLS